MKKAILIIELCIMVVLALATVIFGTSRGVWDGAEFYAAQADGALTVYSHKDGPTVEVLTEDGAGQLRIRAEDGKTADFTFDTTENGSHRSIRLLSSNQTVLLRGTVHAKTGEFVGQPESSGGMSGYAWAGEDFPAALSDRAICAMALGSVGSRISGKLTELLMALLFLGLGLAVTILVEPLIRLDRLVIGIFYRNAQTLEAGALARGFLTVCGMVIFATGAILLAVILLS